MPFTKSQSIHRLTPPADLGFTPGEWIDLYTRWTVGMRERFWKNLVEMGHSPDQPINHLTSRVAILPVIVAEWSDSEPITLAAAIDLDPPIADWIATEFDRLVGGRSEEERQNLDDESLPTSGQDEDASPPTSSTSTRRNGSRTAA